MNEKQRISFYPTDNFSLNLLDFSLSSSISFSGYSSSISLSTQIDRIKRIHITSHINSAILVTRKLMLIRLEAMVVIDIFQS